MVTIFVGYALLETSNQNNPWRFLRNSQDWSRRQTIITPLNSQLAAACSPLDDSGDNGCQIHIIECECGHCWEGYQTRSRILLFTIWPASENGKGSQWAPRVMSVFSHCECLQRQWGHKLDRDLNRIQSLHMSVTSSSRWTDCAEPTALNRNNDRSKMFNNVAHEACWWDQ